LILGHTQPELPGCLRVNATGAPAPRDPELRLPPSLVHLVSLVCLLYLVCLVFWLNESNQINQINKTNQMNQTNQINETNEIATNRGEVWTMPQDMVVRSQSDNDLSTAANGNVGQAPSPYK
jgi:hypothetical protein